MIRKRRGHRYGNRETGGAHAAKYSRSSLVYIGLPPGPQRGPRFCPGSPKRFNENLDVIKRSISNARIRKWALYKLKCANSTPAGVLTQKMLDELEPYASHVIPDRQRFETDHRLARNAYVHQNGNLVNGTVPSGQDLRTHTEAVLFLVWGKLLNILGITLQELIDALRSSFFHWNDLHRAQKMYAKKQEEGGSSCDSASPTDSVE